jgi:hypothetical protein
LSCRNLQLHITLYLLCHVLDLIPFRGFAVRRPMGFPEPTSRAPPTSGKKNDQT